MLKDKIKSKFVEYHKRWNGSTLINDMSIFCNQVDAINNLHYEKSKYTDSELRKAVEMVGTRVRNGWQDESQVNELCAIVKEIIIRTLGITPFDEQIIAGIVMNKGYVAEMQTGEGKTLSAVFPACFNALAGRVVHVLTFNDYLAKRDAHWMGPIYDFLGLKSGYVCQGMDPRTRRAAYNADITYLTAKEAGFDYLRDNLVYDSEDKVQRKYDFALVDEADSIMIDEARIPLVIAGETDDEQDNAKYLAAGAAKLLRPYVDFTFDEYSRNIILTDAGVERAEERMRAGNLYRKENAHLLAALYCALHAEYLLQLNVDYIIRDGKIDLVDEFTGRVADKRRWPDGIQEALELKENIAVRPRGKILNSITLQHFLKLYPAISGMTATASASESEFRDFYGMHIVQIPTHKKCVRKDMPDIIFRTKQCKQDALIREINAAKSNGQPVLVGTASVKESHELAGRLAAEGIYAAVLNAKNDEAEAIIIAQAGTPGTVTISTNMAGRGTDIKLGGKEEQFREEALRAGGLYVIGTNKHESRRIDSQLRGRAGRQGDAGMSRFFVSLEDDICVKYRLADLLGDNFAEKPDPIITDPEIVNEVNRVQRIVEGQNYEIKKTLHTYSALLDTQRQVMNNRREELLAMDTVPEMFLAEFPELISQFVQSAGEEQLVRVCRHLMLLAIDEAWTNHLAEVADLREGIHLNRIGGRDPEFVFRKTVVDMFGSFFNAADCIASEAFRKLKIVNGKIMLDETGLKVPSATWTYLVNDNPFEEMLGIQMLNNVSFSANAVLLGPFLALYYFLKRRKGKKIAH